VTAVTFSRISSLLAPASNDQTIKQWSSTTGQEVQKIVSHNTTVRLWHLITSQEVQIFEKVPFFDTISFSIDNKTVLIRRGAFHIDDELIRDSKDLVSQRTSFL